MNRFLFVKETYFELIILIKIPIEYYILKSNICLNLQHFDFVLKLQCNKSLIWFFGTEITNFSTNNIVIKSYLCIHTIHNKKNYKYWGK